MVKTLPKYVIIQSNLNNKYLHLDTKNPDVPNALRYDGDYSFDLETRFEVVPATNGTGLIHIRSLRNNKYWTYFGAPLDWVTASAVKPEENQSDDGCTLFQPVFSETDSGNHLVLKLLHVSTGNYVRFNGSGLYDGCLSQNRKRQLRRQLSDGLIPLGEHWLWKLFRLMFGGLIPLREHRVQQRPTLRHVNNYDPDECTFIDWSSVVMLPDFIRIKGDNEKHLKALGGRNGYMDYMHKADNSSLFDYEVSPSRDGGVRLRSVYYDKYWTSMDTSHWVLLKEASTTVHETNTVFLPTMVGGGRIILKCLKNGYFCTRFDDKVKTSCLATRYTYPDEGSFMDIEEPVFSRNIENVRYHLTDARLYNERTLALVTDDSSNRTQQSRLPWETPLTSQLNLKTTVSNSKNWSTSVSLKLGVKVTGTFAVPLVSSGALEISTEATGSKSWGETETESIEVGSVRTVTVPPMSRVKASLMATRVSYDIPFSYAQRDVLMNGSTRVTEKNDGLFCGNNGYDYKYDVVELPLEYSSWYWSIWHSCCALIISILVLIYISKSKSWVCANCHCAAYE